MFIPMKTVQDTQKKGSVKTGSVKEGTKGIVDTSTTQMDATEEISANTFTPTVEKEKRTI